MSNQNKLLIICGPTATGKSALGLQLAHELQGELISADSRQIYQGFDIGTGKEVEALQEGRGRKDVDKWIIDDIPVHLYDVVSGHDDYSAAQYATTARDRITDIWAANKLPIVVGGTGLYLKATRLGIESAGVERNNELRDKLEDMPVADLQALMEKEHTVRFAHMNNSDRNNPRRLIRAIELASSPQILPSELQSPLNADILTIGLLPNEFSLANIIDKRVANMFAMGLPEEVVSLLKDGYSFADPAFRAIGYSEFQPYVMGNVPLESVKNDIVLHTRQYVKRQLTWFKADTSIQWFMAHEKRAISDAVDCVHKWYNN